MKKGDIILIRNYTWFGKRIRQVTKGEYNHIGMFVSDNKIVEATMAKGVVISNLSKFEILRKKGKVDFTIYQIKNITEEQRQGMTEFLLDKIGQRYDFFQLIALLFFFSFRINRKYETIDVKKRFICSELLAEAGDKVGIQFKQGVDKDNITPCDIEQSDIIERI